MRNIITQPEKSSLTMSWWLQIIWSKLNQQEGYKKMICLCGSSVLYKHCCGLFHSGKQTPNSPEQLMRSRYCAYTQGNIAYIEKTQAHDAAKDFDAASALRWTRRVCWQGLEVIDAPAVVCGQTKGTVTFKASYSEGNELFCIHELSTFLLTQGRWYYIFGKSLN